MLALPVGEGEPLREVEGDLLSVSEAQDEMEGDPEGAPDTLGEVVGVSERVPDTERVEQLLEVGDADAEPEREAVPQAL